MKIEIREDVEETVAGKLSTDTEGRSGGTCRQGSCVVFRRVEGVTWAEAGCAGLGLWMDMLHLQEQKANQMEAKTRLFSTAKFTPGWAHSLSTWSQYFLALDSSSRLLISSPNES